MDTMTLTKEQMELKAMVPAVQSGNARVRELTPAQRRAVMFAQQQVLRARAAKKAKDERQAALTRIWREEDVERVSARSMSAATETTDEPREVSLREAIGHVLRDLRTHDHKTLREVSEKAGVSLGLPLRSGAWPKRGQLRAAELDCAIVGRLHGADAAHGRRLSRFRRNLIPVGRLTPGGLFRRAFSFGCACCVHLGACRNVNFGSCLKRYLAVAMAARSHATKCLID